MRGMAQGFRLSRGTDAPGPARSAGSQRSYPCRQGHSRWGYILRLPVAFRTGAVLVRGLQACNLRRFRVGRSRSSNCCLEGIAFQRSSCLFGSIAAEAYDHRVIAPAPMSVRPGL